MLKRRWVTCTATVAMRFTVHNAQHRVPLPERRLKAAFDLPQSKAVVEVSYGDVFT